MTQISPISLMMPYNLGAVNCYLIENDANYLLIDSGSPNRGAELEKKLAEAGCKPGNLKLIVLTHGDFDHTGNAAYLRQRFEAPVALHPGDSGMVALGDMFYNRKQPNLLIRKLLPVLGGFGQKQRFTPDIWLEDGYNLAPFGFDAKILSLPGHSKGSVGVLLATGDLFCGDLFVNHGQPYLNLIMDDQAAANASVQNLKEQGVKTIYPGHGDPFPLEQFLSAEKMEVSK